MYTIYDLIFACIMGGFVGILFGLLIMGVASASGYDKAASDAYAIGYEKGKEEGREEEKERIKKKLEQYEKCEKRAV